MVKMKDEDSTKKRKKKKNGKKAEKSVNVPRDVDQGAVITAITQIARHYRARLSAALLDLNIYAGQEQLLLALQKDGAMAPSQLATALGVKAPTITKSVARLVETGLVDKQNAEGDARMVVVALTAEGAALVAQIQLLQAKLHEAFLAGLSKQEGAKLAQLLAKLSAE